MNVIKKIRVVVCGAGGRMGRQILELSAQFSNVEIVGAIESDRSSVLGETVLKSGLKISSNLKALQNNCDVLIDFSKPEATLANLEIIKSWKNCAIVIGTTGFSAQDEVRIKEYSEKIPVLLSPNMSVGVNLMIELVSAVAQRLPDYDIEIVESHHNQKKDAPSGTALALARAITDTLKRTDQDLVYGRSGNVGARTKKEIGIHAVRAGDIVGEHHVMFVGSGEKIELVHQASSRSAFAGGALRASVWLHKKKSGFYTMQNVLKVS